MKKVFEIYDKVAQWLCSFGSDKYLHLLVGLVSAVLVALVMQATTPNCNVAACASMGLIGAAVLMVIKELLNFFRGGRFDVKDIAFGLLGGLLGGLLWLI